MALMKASRTRTLLAVAMTMTILLPESTSIAQSSGRNLLPASFAAGDLANQAGWGKQLIAARNNAIQESDWIARIESGGSIYFESTSAVIAALKLRRDDLLNCKRITGTIEVQGNHARALVGDGSNPFVQFEAKQGAQTFSVELSDLHEPLFFFIQISSTGKVWGWISKAIAEGCDP